VTSSPFLIPLDLGPDEPWRQRAACAAPEVNPDDFHPGEVRDSKRIARAKAVCGRCPVHRECLDWAISSGEPHAIAGGTTHKQRLAMRRVREAS